MSHIFNDEIQYKRTEQVDSFGRLRASTPHTYFDSPNAWKVLPGCKFKLTATNVTNGNWDVSLSFYMIKRKTVNY